MSDDEPGTEIPIATDEDGADSTADPTGSTQTAAASENAASDDAAAEDGIDIAVETGPPDPDVEHRSREESGIIGDSSGGLFDWLDESLLTVLSRALDTETSLRVYVALRRRSWSTPEEIAIETGLYPRTVRDALVALETRGAVTRRGPADETDATGARDAVGSGHNGDDRDDGPGDDPEYAARPPSAVLIDAVATSERGLSASFDLGRYQGSEPTADPGDPVRIDVEDEPEPRADGEDAESG